MKNNRQRMLRRQQSREREQQYRIYRNALLKHELQKQPCFICGEATVVGHHPDYKQPLDVVWLCEKHHNQLHAEHLKGKTQIEIFGLIQ